ncbi:App1 family protein [Maribacter sp. X9]|uniref:App1 family protein n=1 Tax=Maribacter sp. X9 TaxID=3402159 RepID=UPI003AF3AD9C
MKLDLQLYRGYANDTEIVVFGHVFESWGPSNYEIDRNGFYHILALWNMFSIRPLKNVEVQFRFRDLNVISSTNANGYFRFNLPYNFPLEPGWHSYEVICKLEGHRYGIIEKAEFRKPFETGLTIISDIDDTFLISHSGNIWKKLYVLLTRNVNQRKTFEEVEAHYKALENNPKNKNSPNSFFFVSSSEWNLYYFIVQFSILQKLPKSVLKLKALKTRVFDFLKTGGGNHDHKFDKIERIISFYPDSQYVLLGDDSQKDANIYERICTKFPKNIRAVYIRQVSKRPKPAILEKMKQIKEKNIETCYFTNSAEAIAHSKRIGLIKAD